MRKLIRSLACLLNMNAWQAAASLLTNQSDEAQQERRFSGGLDADTLSRDLAAVASAPRLERLLTRFRLCLLCLRTFSIKIYERPIP